MSNTAEIYQMNAAGQVEQLAFQEYQEYTGFQSVNGLEQSAQDIINGQASSWSRVDFGFHTTSAVLSPARTLSAEGHYLIEAQSDPILKALGAIRPGGNPTGQLDEVPLGDALLPLLLLATGYIFYQRIRRWIRQKA